MSADANLGHSNHSVTARYRHKLPGQLADDADLLDAYLSLTGAQTGAHTEEAASLSEI